MQRSVISQLLLLTMLAACRSALADEAAAGASAPTKTAVTSASGDYVGDCFNVGAMSATLPAGWYFVSGQTNVTNGDPTLTLIKATKSGWSLSCVPDKQADKTSAAQASALIEAGATRVGYTYGALTMPYKYYPKSRTFSVSAPIGAYLGLRRGVAGSGHTYAVAFTLSSVKANTVDPKTLVAGKPSVTGTTDVAAISIAAGMMFDILKSATGKPFKAGLFVGVDRANQSSTVSFPENGKPWVALQLGYDFTDN